MNNYIVVTLKNGETMNLRQIEKMDCLLTRYEGDYYLAGNYKLYKMKGNVLCGQEIKYKSLVIHIERD